MCTHTISFKGLVKKWQCDQYKPIYIGESNIADILNILVYKKILILGKLLKS